MDELEKIHNILESTDKTAIFTDLPNEQVAAECGDLLLCHFNKGRNSGAFALIVVTGFETAYSLEGDTTINSLWGDLEHRIKSLIPEQSILFNTYNGFVLHVYGDNSEERIIESLEEICGVFKEPFGIQGRHGIAYTNLGCHIGYLIYPEDCGDLYDYTDITRFLSSAAWFKSDLGTGLQINMQRYNALISSALLRRESIIHRLHEAIENDTLYFEYQPEIDIHDYSVSAIEILIRWEDSVLGQVSPEEFIPILEKIETIIPFTEYSIDKAIARIIEMNGQFPEDCRFFLNISKSIFYWENFNLCEYILDTLEKYQCSPDKFGIEITESAYFEPSITSKVRKVLAKLYECGVKIVIDDFGTGYGSLSLLSSNTITGIKLDKSLTSNLVSRSIRTDFLDMLCHLAERYTIRLVAEGVEHDWQVEMLKLKKVPVAQGYNLCPPVGEEKLLNSINSI